MARSIFYYTDSRILGGAERALFMLIAALDREAWQPTLLLDAAPGTEVLAQRAHREGVPVRLVEPMPLGLEGARRVPGLVRMLRAERPDVFHAQLSWPLAAKFALVAAVLARVPAVVATVQLIPELELGRSSRLQLRALSRRVGRCIAVSRQIAGELTERFGWPAAKLEVVYNAVELDRFDEPAPAGLRAELSGGEERPLVLSVARLHEQKGHDVLLRAAAEVPEAVFVLAGEGPERGALEALAAELGIAGRVRFLGERGDVPALLAACDVFALPSLYEGSSLAVLEAMAARRAVVSSAIGGTDELIDDGETGLLVPPRDAAALAGALRRLLGDAALRDSLAGRARARVESELGRDQMARRVTKVYGELLGDAAEPPREALPEARRNALLRRLDWRFALPGAELVARRLPRIGGAGRARRRAEAAGFAEVRVYWPGPLPYRLPQFWLPVDSPPAVERLLASRPPRSLAGVALRRLWRLAWRAGLLAPLYVVGRRAGADPAGGELPLPLTAPLLLLTGGRRSVNKVVGLAVGEDGEAAAVVKLARLPEAEAGLEREAGALAFLERELPGFGGAPRLLARGRRDGRLAVAETAIEGGSLLEALTAESFPGLARRVTRLLIELAGAAATRPPGEWWDRLVGERLERFERDFGAVAGPGRIARARSLLEGLGALPVVCEHRDCAPWNVVLTASGEPALLDWESAEPRGLPGLDLVYFLANSAFVLEGALESGRTREVYAGLLDPSTAYGRVAAGCIEEYGGRLGLDAEAFRRLRLLCWIVHSRSEHRHLEMAAAGPPAPAALRGGVFLGLVEEELR